MTRDLTVNHYRNPCFGHSGDGASSEKNAAPKKSAQFSLLDVTVPTDTKTAFHNEIQQRYQKM